MAHPGGRPLKFQSVEELQEKIDAYFNDCDPHMQDFDELQYPKNEEGLIDLDAEPEIVIRRRMSSQIHYTITGLAMALDTSRETLLDYEDKEEFSDTIKKAKLRIHNYVEQHLFGNNVAGPIFNLKNNYGWRDKTEHENSGEQKLIIETRKRSADKDD